MSKIRGYTVGAVAVLAVAACTAGVLPDDDYTDANPNEMLRAATGDGFAAHLQREYLARAIDATDNDANPRDAYAYINRARRVRLGENVEAIDPQTVRRNYWPSRPSVRWDDSALALWQEVRTAVGTHRDHNPKACASLQAMFDQWVEEEAEWTLHYTHPDTIRAQIPAALDACGGTAVVDTLEPLIDDRFIVHFAFSSAELDSNAREKIGDIAREVLARTDLKHVRVIGHTDRAGDVPFNDVLSRMRAGAVAKGLADAGVPRALLKIQALGESAPSVKTADGIRSRLNRRVIIRFEEN